MLSRTLLCLALTAASTPLLADTVWLKNGDKLTGTIKVFDGGKLLLETEYGGAIPIDWKKVKTLESDQPSLVKQDQYTGEVAKSLKASDDGKVVLANGEAPKTVELRAFSRSSSPSRSSPIWSGRAISTLRWTSSRPRTTPMITTSRSRHRRVTVSGVITPEANTTAKPQTMWSAPTTGAPSTRSTAS